MKKLLLLLPALLVVTSSVFAASNILTWDYLATDVATYGVTGFPLERKAEACAGTGAWSLLATPAATLRTYADSAVAPGITYCYRVYAEGPGGRSAASNTVARTVPFAVPVAPSGLTVVGGP